MRKCGSRTGMVITLSLGFAMCGCFPWIRLDEKTVAKLLTEEYNSNPMVALSYATQHGDYRFRGLTAMNVRPGPFRLGRMWLPGMFGDRTWYSTPENFGLLYERVGGVSGFQTFDSTCPWADAAIRYCTAYNRALLIKRRGRKLNSDGFEIR